MKKQVTQVRILKFLFIIGIVLGASYSKAQNLVVKPVDLNHRAVVGMVSDNTGLYQAYIYRRSADKRFVLTLAYWNQIYWVNKKTIVLDSTGIVRGIKIAPNNDVIIYGRFTYQIAPSLVEYRNILIYSKDKWFPSARFNQFKKESIVNSVAWKNDTLLFAGIFDSISNKRFMNIGKYYKNQFYTIANFNDVVGVNGAVQQIAYRDNKLFVSGNFATAAAKTVKGFTYLENNEWKVITKGFVKADKFTFLGKDVIIHSVNANNQFFRIDIAKDKTTDFSLGLSKVNRLNDLVSYNNTIYAVGDFNLTLGNLRTGWISYNTFWNTVNIAQDCKFIDSSNHGLYVVGRDLLGPFPISQTQHQYIGKYEVGEKLIYGYLYLDNNANCEYDSMIDNPIVNRSIRFGTEKAAVFTDKYSRFYYYYNKVENKMPRLLMDQRAFKYSLCVKDSNDLKNPTKPVIFTTIAVSTSGLKKAKLDTRVIVHGGQRIRKAGKNAVTYLIANIGLGEAKDLKVTLKGTKKMKDLVTLTKVKHQVNDSSIVWDLPNIPALGFTYITVVYGIQDNSDIVDNILDFEVVHEYNNQIEVESGEDFFSQVITEDDNGALKEQGLPNLPQSEFASIAATDTIIEYQITFQNRTNEIVNEVVVIDTLDLRYNFLYTQTIASSHPFSTEIRQDPVDPNIGYLIYTFTDLNLVANLAADPEIINDEGYIKFKFVFDRKHDLNDQIKNTALIIMNDNYYFPTNEVLSSVDHLVSTPSVIKKGAIGVYPNPTSTILNLQLKKTALMSYSIIDLRGAEILSAKNINSDVIDVQRLVKGLYILKLEQDGELFYAKFVKE